jgi:sugar fermentation stimulation protein A
LTATPSSHAERADALPVHMPRAEPLVPGTLLRRYKRFLADVQLDSGSKVTAHCVNTGAMEGLTRPGTRIWLSRADNPKRRLKFTWETAEIAGRMVGVNTSLPNRVVGLLLRQRALPWLARWEIVTAERHYGQRSRVDFHLSGGGREHYLEVKNCHLVYPDGRAYFPDCVSGRAAEHLRELAQVVGHGCSAEVLFVVQVPGARAVRPSDVHDPVFAASARMAHAAGVQFSAIVLSQTPDAITVEKRIPVDLRPYGTARVARWREAARAE